MKEEPGEVGGGGGGGEEEEEGGGVVEGVVEGAVEGVVEGGAVEGGREGAVEGGGGDAEVAPVVAMTRGKRRRKKEGAEQVLIAQIRGPSSLQSPCRPGDRKRKTILTGRHYYWGKRRSGRQVKCLWK